MITTILLVVAALFIVAFLFSVARGHEAPVQSIDELVSRTQPVDMEAFRNLVSLDEECYLREKLLPAQFRTVQRERMRAAVEYVRRTAHNSALMLRLGQTARQQEDSNVAKAGEDLVNGALQLRIDSMFAMWILYARILAPSAQIRVSSLLDHYQSLRNCATNLSRLQMPSAARRVEASL